MHITTFDTTVLTADSIIDGLSLVCLLLHATAALSLLRFWWLTGRADRPTGT